MTTSRTLSVALLALSAAASSGCATIINGTTQPIFFDSEPQGAEIDYKGKVYTTPCLISLSRSFKTVQIPIYKSGFAPQTIECKVRETGLVFGNILLGGIVGVFVDAATAASMKYTEENHRAFLLPVDDVFAKEFDEARAAAKVKAAEEKKKRDEESEWSTVARRR